MNENNTYTSKDIAAIFKVSTQAAKSWAREFAEYLSPTARPESGKRRLFTDNDMRVFALVREYTLNGYNFVDAHLALKAGQRAEVPSLPDDIIPTPPPQLLVALRQEIDRLNQRVWEEKASGDESKGQVKLLKEQLAEKEQRIEKLYMELAEERAKHRD